MKILIIRLSALGDIIHSLPTAAYIKKKNPDSEIAWLTEPSYAQLVTNNPAIDQAILLPKRLWLEQLRNPVLWPKTISHLTKFWGSLQAQHFDAALDLQGLLKSSLCAIACGASKRFGFAHTRELADQFLTHKLNIGNYFGPNIHIVDLNLTLAKYMCECLEFRETPSQNDSEEPVTFPLPCVPENSQEKIEQIVREAYPVSSRERFAVLVPGTTWTSKIWPKANWCRLAQLLAQELSYHVVLSGSSLEQDSNSQITSWLQENCPEAQVVNLTGKTDLLDLMALFQRCNLVIGADSGPLHLAAAIGKAKVIGIYGSTPVKRNGPYGKQCYSIALNLSCQPCFSKICPLSTTACLMDLHPEAVFEEIRSQLSGGLLHQNKEPKV